VIHAAWVQQKSEAILPTPENFLYKKAGTGVTEVKPAAIWG
jgi:hypothetical protein